MSPLTFPLLKCMAVSFVMSRNSKVHKIKTIKDKMLTFEMGIT